MIHANPVKFIISTSYGFATALNNIKAQYKKAVTIENEFPSGYFALDKWSKNIRLV